MPKHVRYRHLYDPDYDPDENGLYYDDTPPCSLRHNHAHNNGCGHNHSNDTSPGAHEHVHGPNCSHSHSDQHNIFSAIHQKDLPYTDLFSSLLSSPVLISNENDDDDDNNPPPLVEISSLTDVEQQKVNVKQKQVNSFETYEYKPDNTSSKFPAYPESFNPDKCELPAAKIKETKSLFRKRLEAIWDDCWDKVAAVVLYCKPLAAPFIKFYHKIYIPYVLVNILNLCGGTEHAGRIGRYARISQFLGASLTWGALIALIVIVGFTSVWTLGLAAPLWALILGFGGIGINMAGSMVAAAANHGKIEPFYREEIKLHDENNALRKQVSLIKKINIPEMGLEHGYLHSSKERQKVHMHRYEHDAQTWVVGSGSSIIASILEFASIAVGVGGIFLMISRFSSVFSLFGASYVNQDRLSLFKKVISKKINSYYGLKHQLEHEKHKAIYVILSEKLNDLKINKNHYYSRWVKFYCYRAIDAAYDNAAEIKLNTVQINLALQKVIGDHLTKERGFFANNKDSKKYFSRSYLRSLIKINGLSVLDSMPVLESSLRDTLETSKNEAYAVMAVMVDNFSNAHMDSEDTTSFLFLKQLKFALVKHFTTGSITKENLLQAIINNPEFFYATLDKKYILNKEKISQSFPLKGPHGAQITPDYHAKKLVEHIIIPTLKNQKAVATINQTLYDFCETDMNKWDPSSLLFILHLKCALIKHSIKNINQENLADAVKFGKYFFSQEKNKTLNKEKIAKALPVDDKHGGLAEPDDHAKEVVDNIILPYLKNVNLQNNFKAMSDTVDEFYEANMDTLDASSDLFILHLKCALMKALIEEKIIANNITCSNIKTAVENNPEFFHKSEFNWMQPFKTTTSKPVLDLAKITMELQVKKTHNPERVFANEFVLPKLCVAQVYCV